MKIGILGSGQVARTLAAGLRGKGHDVVMGTRRPDELRAWAQPERIGVADFAAAAASGDLVILAVKGLAAEAVLDLAGAGSLQGKLVIDACNPIADAPPENGVLRFFTSLDESLMERLQRRVPGAHFVKAFSCVGNALMIDPQLAGGRPSMFICGNDADAKAQVVALLDQVGWDSEDMGGVEAARAIEPLCMLWCIPGLQHGDWRHAYRVLR